MMNPLPTAAPEQLRYELRFRSLFDPGRAYAFPCDALGHVDLDALSDRARENYLYARTVIGRDFSVPAVSVAKDDANPDREFNLHS